MHLEMNTRRQLPWRLWRSQAKAGRVHCCRPAPGRCARIKRRDKRKGRHMRMRWRSMRNETRDQREPRLTELFDIRDVIGEAEGRQLFVAGLLPCCQCRGDPSPIIGRGNSMTGKRKSEICRCDTRDLKCAYFLSHFSFYHVLFWEVCVFSHLPFLPTTIPPNRQTLFWLKNSTNTLTKSDKAAAIIILDIGRCWRKRSNLRHART